jgi:hypothetical protein
MDTFDDTQEPFRRNQEPRDRVTSSQRNRAVNPSELVDQVVGVTKNLGSVVGKEARAMAGRVTAQLSETAEAGVGRGAESLSNLGKAFQAAGREIAPESPGLARTLDDVASQVDSFADTIRGRSLSELVSGAAELAKRNPTLFLAGTIAAGFVASRFIRSTASGNTDRFSSNDFSQG